MSRIVDQVTYLPRTAPLLPRLWAEPGSLRVPATSVYTRTDGMVAWTTCRYPVRPRRENIEVRGSHRASPQLAVRSFTSGSLTGPERTPIAAMSVRFAACGVLMDQVGT